MKKTKNSKKRNQLGFMALTSVAVMGAFFVIVFVGMFFSSTEEVDREVDRESSIQALYFSESCVKIGLNELKKDSDYFGGDYREFDLGSCEVVDTYDHFEDNDLKVIESRGEVNQFERNLRVVVDLSNHPDLEINKWEEVPYFE